MPTKRRITAFSKRAPRVARQQGIEVIRDRQQYEQYLHMFYEMQKEARSEGPDHTDILCLLLATLKDYEARCSPTVARPRRWRPHW
jgi:hypothetical protein